MAGEYKKVREFKRDTVCRTLVDFLNRCYVMNSNELDDTEAAAYYNIKDLTVFGSFVNSDKEKVHDLDVHLVLERSELCSEMSYEEIEDFSLVSIPKTGDFVGTLYWLEVGSLNYLKNSSPILSLDTEDDVEELSGTKVKLIEDYEFNKENIKKIFEDNKFDISQMKLKFLR